MSAQKPVIGLDLDEVMPSYVQTHLISVLDSSFTISRSFTTNIMEPILQSMTSIATPFGKSGEEQRKRLQSFVFYDP